MKIDINHDLFSLHPLENREEYFPDFIQTYLNKYTAFLSGYGSLLQDERSAVQRFSAAIVMCLAEYYYGQHGSATQFFSEAMGHIQIEDAFVNLHETVFYRARHECGKRLTGNEMFHIPLEKRYLVSTRRYSYPGLPCLYLGSSVEVCCAELDYWDSDLNVARIEREPEKTLSALDLTFYESYNFDALTPHELRSFVRLWPLIACCSFVYRETKNMAFRPDYVLPQLLLEYVIDKNADVAMGIDGSVIQGIKYRSVRHPFFGKGTQALNASFHNYVFPALSPRQQGCCEILQDIFKVRRVCLLGEI